MLTSSRRLIAANACKATGLTCVTEIQPDTVCHCVTIPQDCRALGRMWVTSLALKLTALRPRTYCMIDGHREASIRLLVELLHERDELVKICRRPLGAPELCQLRTTKCAK